MTFRAMADAMGAAMGDGGAALREQLVPVPELEGWLAAWRARLEAEPMAEDARRAGMRAASPVVIPRNHLVERALFAAEYEGDMGPFEALLAVVRRPFEEPADRAYRDLPPPGLPAYQTFCGT